MQTELLISTERKQEFVDITPEVTETVKISKIKKGLCNVFVPHATAAIAINENADPNLQLDIIDALDAVAESKKWRHDTIDGNAAAHIKSAIIGPSQTIPIKEGVLQLGRWQDIFLCEFDGPRKRNVIITITKGE